MHAILLGAAAIAAVSACGRGPTGAAPAADSPADALIESAQQMEPTRGSRPPDGWLEGEHYEVLDPPVRRAESASRGKVRVVEFFWYGCRHCYVLEFDLGAWLEQQPQYFEFERVPVTWRFQQEAHARLYYTLRALGREDLNGRVFETIHERRQLLFADDAAETYRLQLAFAMASGIPERDFAYAYHSAGVNAAIEEARQLTRECRVTAVPTMVIDGKHLTSPGRAGGKKELLALVAVLAAREARRP